MHSTNSASSSASNNLFLQTARTGFLSGFASRLIVRGSTSTAEPRQVSSSQRTSLQNLARGLLLLRSTVADLRGASRVSRFATGRVFGAGTTAEAKGFAAARSGSSLGLDLTQSFTTLRSSGAINPQPNAFQLASPLSGSTSSPTLGGAYDGSQGTDTLTFKIKDSAVVGANPFDVEVEDGSGQLLETVSFGADPPGTTKTLANGVTLSFDAGSLKNGDEFTVDVTSGDVQPDNPFNGTGVKDPNFAPGQSVVAGSFFVNGVEISVQNDDTIQSVLDAINASGVGVSATFDSAAEEVLLTHMTPGTSTIVLGSDDTGFFDAVNLTGATQVLGFDAGDADRTLTQVAALSGIANGSFSINGVGFTVDTQADTLNDLLARINASAADVTATLDSVNGTFVITSDNLGQDLVLDDGTSGLFAGLGVSAGTFADTSTAALGSALGLETTGVPFTTLGSVEQLNTAAFFSGPYSVTFGGSSTTTPTLGGVYDGAQGDDTLTFKLKDDGSVGSDNIEIEVTDGNGDVVDTVVFADTDPPDTVKTLSNGLTLSLSAGLAVKDETFQIQVASGVVDPDGKFKEGGPGANLQSGFGITAGDFYINGTKIGIAADDTINKVITKINGSGAGVIASFDAATERFLLTQSTAGPQNEITLGSDDSGFFAAFKLTGATQTLAGTPESATIFSQVPKLSGISDGTFTINGAQLTVDTQADSLEDVLDRINASAAGVTAAFDASDNQVVLTSNTPGEDLVLGDGTSNLFSALGISTGTVQAPAGGGGDQAVTTKVSEPTKFRKNVRGFLRNVEQLFGSTPDSFTLTLQEGGVARVKQALEKALDTQGSVLRTGFGIDFSFRDPTRIDVSFDENRLSKALSRDSRELVSFLVGDKNGLDGGFLDAIDEALGGFAATVAANLDPSRSKGLILDLRA